MIFSSDFVTNSSSTSFVLVTNDKKRFTKGEFLKSIGVCEDSPLAVMYLELFNLIESALYGAPVSSFEEINENYRCFGEFSADGEAEIKARMARGEKAYVGEIADDNAVGAYFMRKKIVIIGDDFYFNWEPDGY